ncbi:hypothetical protein AYK24_02100 [Thermoplasmatales archaeon SG8-52-4]|nr:MAG: hypothetical protein AYK24_02100 [Thermoplasmatales archaeon SG8-52-4]
MKNSYYKKIFTFSMIVLFFMTCFTPGISSNTGVQSNKNITNNFYLNNYVNSYWKFDECNGEILEDSSGHNYDGTINGATWTDGYSGCALEFDGVNDYVDLNAHIDGLGFNKTDDIIFSFYFKSLSPSDGVIYSMSNTDGSLLKFFIELNSDGKLEVSITTPSCGFLLTSNYSYNDGFWHHAEIIYNGIASDPTIEMYIDDDFENSITIWVCHFEVDGFNKAKIGINCFNSTKPYYGEIDEFKIIKYPGGNKQEPPIIEGPTSGQPEVEYYFNITINDPEDDDLWILIDWNDSWIDPWTGPYTSGTMVLMSHEWADEGIYEIKTKIKDIWGESSWSTHTIVIGNLPPEKPIINGTVAGRPGITYHYIFTSIDPNDDEVSYYIHWGDGSTTDWTDFRPSGEPGYIESHSWKKGNYIIQAKTKDIYDSESEWTEFIITMPRDKILNRPFLSGLFEKFPFIERIILYLID